MRAVIQRAARADVVVNGVTVGSIGRGIVILLGVGQGDTADDADYLADKAVGLRIFPDAEDKMNLSVLDISGAALVVSQFTLYGDVRRGKRPSFSDAAAPEQAKALYEHFVARLKALGLPQVATGEFQAMMDVTLTNAGPVTILLDSRKTF